MERRAEYIRMSFAGDDSVILKEVKARLRELNIGRHELSLDVGYTPGVVTSWLKGRGHQKPSTTLLLMASLWLLWKSNPRTEAPPPPVRAATNWLEARDKKPRPLGFRPFNPDRARPDAVPTIFTCGRSSPRFTHPGISELRQLSRSLVAALRPAQAPASAAAAPPAPAAVAPPPRPAVYAPSTQRASFRFPVTVSLDAPAGTAGVDQQAPSRARLPRPLRSSAMPRLASFPRRVAAYKAQKVFATDTVAETVARAANASRRYDTSNAFYNDVSVAMSNSLDLEWAAHPVLKVPAVLPGATPAATKPAVNGHGAGGPQLANGAVGAPAGPTQVSSNGNGVGDPPPPVPLRTVVDEGMAAAAWLPATVSVPPVASYLPASRFQFHEPAAPPRNGRVSTRRHRKRPRTGAWPRAEEVAAAIAKRARRSRCPSALYRSVTAEVLVPISLDITVDGVHLRDAFRWNLHDRHTTPDAFAAVLCSDLSLPPGFHSRIVSSIMTQLVRFKPAVTRHLPCSAEAAGEAHPHKLRRGSSASGPSHEDGVPQPVEALCPITLCARRGDEVFRDCFEWDVATPLGGNVDAFVSRTLADLNLDSSWAPVLAVALTREVEAYQDVLREGKAAAAASVRGVRGLRSQQLRLRSRTKIDATNVERDSDDADHFQPMYTEVLPLEAAQAAHVAACAFASAQAAAAALPPPPPSPDLRRPPPKWRPPVRRFGGKEPRHPVANGNTRARGDGSDSA